MFIIPGWKHFSPSPDEDISTKNHEYSNCLLSSNSFRHILEHILLYNLTPKLFRKFSFQNFESEQSLYSPFIRILHWTYFLANHINLSAQFFKINLDLNKTLSILEQPLEKDLSWWPVSFFLERNSEMAAPESTSRAHFEFMKRSIILKTF